MKFVFVNYRAAVRLYLLLISIQFIGSLRTSSDRSTETSDALSLSSSTKKDVSATVSVDKHVNEIIKKKCEEYGNARYKTILQEGRLIGQKPRIVRKLDCVQTQGLIYGGEHAKIKEFPHMALVGYGNDIDDITWACGGSLISERFVLSAAHCTRPNSILNHVQWVALGILKRTSLTPDKLNKNIFRVIETFNHPDYDEQYTNNDIALYKLQNSIMFSPWLRPICLPTSVGTHDPPKQKLTVTGWGKTSADEDLSETLLKAGVYFAENNLCTRTFKKDPRLKDGFDRASMVCASNLRQGNDTCAGDSGGPIQIPVPGEQCMLTAIGVTSYGSAFCGNKITPAIYTRISNYLPWIQKIVWP